LLSPLSLNQAPLAKLPIVTDRPLRDGVLVLRALPAECAVVVHQCGFAGIAAVVCEDNLTQLAVVLTAVLEGHRVVGRRVLELAQRLPKLTLRQHRVLQHLGRGQPVHQLGRDLKTSPATVKREIATLEAAFGVTNRTQLALTAQRLGYPTPMVDLLI
jgi:DNA-binding NarL/FixJ family response regulator